MITLYNLHIYIGKNDKLQVVTIKWKDFDIVNSSIFSLSELKEVKSCKYCVETAHAGKNL